MGISHQGRARCVGLSWSRPVGAISPKVWRRGLSRRTALPCFAPVGTVMRTVGPNGCYG